jgi:hypothetical protein
MYSCNYDNFLGGNMNILFKKLAIAVMFGFSGFVGNIVAMQGLIANFYNPFKTKNKRKYSINLMWINEKFNKEQEFIHPSNNEFVSTICKWAALNQNGVVNVLYDGELSTPEAIENTKKAIQKKHLGNALMASIIQPSKTLIKLKDVREFPEVKEHSTIFSDSRMPVYFRADILRPIAGYNAMSQGETDYFVYSDLDVKPLSENQLFDTKTKKYLEQYGMVMAYGGEFLGFENSFQIISNHKPNLLEAIKLVNIDLNIERAYNAQNGKLANASRRKPKGPYFKPLEQIVYDSYRPMFEYFYHLEGCGTCFAPYFKDGIWDDKMYDKNMHGLNPFGPRSLGDKTIVFKAKNDWCRGKRHDYNGKKYYNEPYIPIKKVNVPRSHFG